MTASAAETADVVIVGAGPVGLTPAGEPDLAGAPAGHGRAVAAARARAAAGRW